MAQRFLECADFELIKNFKHHKNVSNHILFYVFIISQHFTAFHSGYNIIKIKYFEMICVILHFYQILTKIFSIDQSESTAKILDLVQVNHWTDHKTNIVAASFQLLKKKKRSKKTFFDGHLDQRDQLDWYTLKKSIFERKFRKAFRNLLFLKCKNLPKPASANSF